MTSCIPCVKVSETKRHHFLIGQLKRKPNNEQQFYQLSYPALHKLRIGRINFPTKAQYRTRPEESFFVEDVEDETQQQQTYIQWRSATEIDVLARLTRGRRTTIYIQPIGVIPQEVLNYSLHIDSKDIQLLDILKTFTEIFFYGKVVKVLPSVDISEKGWNITNRTSPITGETQLLVRDFYKYLKKILPQDGICIMGMSFLDLYPSENLRFALGESSTPHKAGVFCFGRFEPNRHSKTAESTTVQQAVTAELDQGPMLWQLLKTLTHEVCHLFHLEHCPFFRCTMNESHTVREAMDQPLFLCPVCLRKIQKACSFRLLERYTKMLAFLSQVYKHNPYHKFEDSIHWLEKAVDFLKRAENK